jgi:hypothetical protein
LQTRNKAYQHIRFLPGAGARLTFRIIFGKHP